MLKPSQKQILSHFAMIAVFAFLAMSSSFYYGLTSGNDLPQHYQFAHTIHQSISSFEIYPSLSPDINNGYGDYAIRFYPPLGYYLLATLYIVTSDWYFASLTAFFFIFFCGGVGAYLWAKEEYQPPQALLAAALFIFAPYHVNQIYNNFLFAEFASSAVIPFCFLFITRICRKGSFADVAGLAFFYGLLIITHLPLTIISSLVFGIYSLCLIRKHNIIKNLVKLSTAVVMGVTASSFYWLRMITEINWVNHSSEKYFASIYSYQENFLLRPQNILNFQDDVSALWLADLMLIAILLICLPSIFLLIKERKNLSKLTIATSIVFFVSVLMTTSLSSFLWNNLEFLQKVQFPWRWLGIVSLSGAIFAAQGIIYASEKMQKSKNIFLPLGLGFVLLFFVFSTAFIIKQAYYVPRQEFNKQIAGLSDQPSFECWWTVWMKNTAFQTQQKALADNRKSEILKWNATERTIKVESGASTKLRVAAFYYPHWQAFVNNRKVEIEKAEDGAMIISLPTETAEVSLKFVEPQIVKTANIFSVLMWLFLIFFIVFSAFKSILGLGKPAPEIL